MKTVFINCSPKKRFCASAYFLSLQRLFVKGTKVTEKLRNQKDHQRILHELSDADTVVFCLPLYVDGIPSHVLPFLKEMELFCRENQIHLSLYSISNNGFIEGCQSEPLLQVFLNFLPTGSLENFAVQTLILLFFNLGVLFYILQMGCAVNKGRNF